MHLEIYISANVNFDWVLNLYKVFVVLVCFGFRFLFVVLASCSVFHFLASS